MLVGALVLGLVPYNPPAPRAWVWLSISGDHRLLERSDMPSEDVLATLDASGRPLPAAIASRDFWVQDADTGEFLFGLVGRGCAPGGSAAHLLVGGTFEFQASNGAGEMAALAERATAEALEDCKPGSKWTRAEIMWPATHFPQFEGRADELRVARASLPAPYLFEHRLAVFGEVASVRVATGVGSPKDCAQFAVHSPVGENGGSGGYGWLNAGPDLGDHFGYVMCVSFKALFGGPDGVAGPPPTFMS